MPRYVILEHDHPFRHWDFMLEAGAVLRTWRLLSEPHPHGAIPAEPLGDHRIFYLEYEGALSGNRGRVQRWDAGVFAWIRDGAEDLAVELQGQRLAGNAVLARADAGRWVWNFA